MPALPHPRSPLPELLAPAGSPDAFRAALAAGADAVYLSGKRFGARRFAANFTDTEIEEALRTAHTRGVRVYVTVNTLVHDRELASVTEYLIWLYSIGIDAVLVQDAGLAALARELVPGLPLHASTQMTIHNAEGVRWAAKQGFSRVVLARELALDDIRAIAEETAETGTGLEVFAHGALCYSYSGQCLLSSLIGGRSGNRGTCAQPCRKPWTLVAGRTDEYGRPAGTRPVPSRDRYLLSPKDLCTYRNLPELVRSPVVSLKIEGRMKSPAYVATVVAIYRRALDAIAAGTWEPSGADERDLYLAFNRGFTKGYLLGDRHELLMGRDAPDNRGLRIGTVTTYDRVQAAAIVRQDSPLIPETGDGLLIVHPDYPGETGFALNTPPLVKKDGLLLRVPRPVRAGSAVFITSSRALDEKARRILAKPSPDLLRPVPVDLVAEADGAGIFTLWGTVERPDGTVVPITCRPQAVLSPAGSSPLSREDVARQLTKSGGTPFRVRSLDLTYDGSRFAPIKEINRVRREFFSAAEEQLAASYRPAMPNVRRAQHRWLGCMASRETRPAVIRNASPLRLVVWCDSLDGLRAALSAGAGRVCFEPDLYLPARTCGKQAEIVPPEPVIREALAACRDAGVPLFWKFPRIVPDRFLRIALPALPGLAGAGLAGVTTDDRGTAARASKTAPRISLDGPAGLNIFNHAAARAASPPFSSVTLSPELGRDEIATLMQSLAAAGRGPACSVIVQGHLDAMVTEDCIKRLHHPCRADRPRAGQKPSFTGICDEQGVIWPAWSDKSCRTTIGSAAELCLIGHLPFLHTAGIAEIIIDARHHPARYAGEMTALYRAAMAMTDKGMTAGKQGAGIPSLKKRAETIATGGSTTGHFLRGLKES